MSQHVCIILSLVIRAGSCSVIDHAQIALSKSSAFHFFLLPLFDRITLPTLLAIISYSRVPKTRKERALRHPNQHLHPRLRTQQTRELPCNMHAHVARISNSCAGVPAAASLEYATWYPVAYFSRPISVARVPPLASGANAFVSLNSPANWLSNGDLPVAQRLCERSTRHRGGSYNVFRLGSFRESMLLLCVRRVRPMATSLRSLRINCEMCGTTKLDTICDHSLRRLSQRIESKVRKKRPE